MKQSECSTPGAILDEARISIEHDGFHDILHTGEPHDQWCVLKREGNVLLMAPVLGGTPEIFQAEKEGSLMLPHRVITHEGKRLFLALGHLVIRDVGDVEIPGFTRSVVDFVMPVSLAAAQKAARYNLHNLPADDGPPRNWEVERFIKGELWNHWGGGIEGKPELTLLQARKLVTKYLPPYDGDDKAMRRRIYDYFTAKIEEHGPDYPVRHFVWP